MDIEIWDMVGCIFSFVGRGVWLLCLRYDEAEGEDRGGVG